MFNDPQSVTVSAVAQSLARTGSGIGFGTFSTNDGNYGMEVRQSLGKRFRRTVSITSKKYSADPLRPAENVPVSATIRIIVDAPVQGFSAADLEALYVGFVANLAASSNTNLKKLLGGEA